MAFEKELTQLDMSSEAMCIHLRSKAMYVTGLTRPEGAEEPGSHYFWCNRTQHVMGPDRQHVDGQACVAGRSCFRESH